MSDVKLSYHGTLVGLALNTPAAIEWADEHLPDDAPRMGKIVYAEPRYVDHIVDGMRNDGLEVND